MTSEEGVRILAISDEVTISLYTTNLREVTGHLDLLLSCGDLPYSYMEFVLKQSCVREAYYVHGNHDRAQRVSEDLELVKPRGWRNIDRRVVFNEQHDLIVAGLEGAPHFQEKAPYQYTENQMFWRAMWLAPQLLVNRVLHGRYVDILIAHSPPKGIHDHPLGAHRGFPVFLDLMHRFKPRLFFHGHNHRYGLGSWKTRCEHTDVVNVHPFCVCDLMRDTIRFEYPHADPSRLDTSSADDVLPETTSAG